MPGVSPKSRGEEAGRELVTSKSFEQTPPHRPPLPTPARAVAVCDNQNCAVTLYTSFSLGLRKDFRLPAISLFDHNQFNGRCACVTLPRYIAMIVQGSNDGMPTARATFILRQYGIFTYRDPPFSLAIGSRVRKFGEVWPALFDLIKLVASKSGWWFVLLVGGTAVRELVHVLQLHLDAILAIEVRYFLLLYRLISRIAPKITRTYCA